MWDRIMSNDKLTVEAPESATGKLRSPDDTMPPGAKKPVSFLSLEIDENDDFGADPYNHTGSFCVPKFGDD